MKSPSSPLTSGVDGIEFKKLKPGPSQPAVKVAADQRRRLGVALVELAAEGGPECVTVRGLCRKAKVSTGTFYRHHTNLQGCVDATSASLLRRRRSGSLNELIVGLLADIAHKPALAGFALVDALCFPDRRLSTGGAEKELTSALVRLRSEGGCPQYVSTARVRLGIVSGLLYVARKTTFTGKSAQLINLAEALSDWTYAFARVASPDLSPRPLRDAAPLQIDRLPDPYPGAA